MYNMINNREAQYAKNMSGQKSKNTVRVGIDLCSGKSRLLVNMISCIIHKVAAIKEDVGNLGEAYQSVANDITEQMLLKRSA